MLRLGIIGTIDMGKGAPMVEFKTGDILAEKVEALVNSGQLCGRDGTRHRAAIQEHLP